MDTGKNTTTVKINHQYFFTGCLTTVFLLSLGLKQ